VLAPTLKRILESPDTLKCGVNIKGDFTRMSNHLGIEVVSLFELSHLYRLVEYGVTNRALVNRRLVRLAEQTEKHLGLPLSKGDERVSDWSQSLNHDQCKYAADDAYASYRVFEALKEKWYQLDPRPPFPAYAELDLPIKLAPLQEKTTSESEASDVDTSEYETTKADEDEVALLKKRLKDIVIGEASKKGGSGDDYGENVFDGLTEEQLLELEGPLTQQLPASEQRITYPTLQSELAFGEPHSFYVGRLGLQPRLNPMTSPRHRNEAANPAPPSPTSVSESELDSDEDVEDTIPDQQSNSNAYPALILEATRWAEGAQKDPQELSNKSEIKASVAALRAYYFWEIKAMGLAEIAVLLRPQKPLKPSTVACYVSECLQFSHMKYSDRGRLQTLAKHLPRQTLQRYWRIRKWAEEEE
jgi:hypothetical protein